MAGRRPKPTKLKLLAGNPGKRPLNEREPEPKTKGVRMPASLTPAAKVEWRRVAPELRRLGLLTVVDVGLLEVYCEAAADFRAATKFLEENGKTYVLRDKDGQVRYVAQFPQVAIARNAADLMRKCAIEFGFTPASRSKIKVPKTEADDGGKFW